MKKLNLLLLLIFSVISLNISAHDFEAVNSDGKTIYYNIISSADLTVEVTYKGSYSDDYNEYAGEITIPLSVTYNGETYSVTSIGDNAFRGCSGLTSVTIPNSVTSIGSWAFEGCSGLTSVTIPNSVTLIGIYAFSGCSGLTSVTIPNSVTSIENWAFEGCSGLTSVTIPNSVTTIRGSAFWGCSGLTSVTIPNSVTSIGGDAFWGCSGLTSVTIPNSVTSIGKYAFMHCSGLTSVTIPNSVTLIGERAFLGCSGLTSVTIPNSVTSIGGDAFYGCSGLKELTLEDGEEKLSFGSDVFDETPLESVYLGRSLSDASSASSSLFYSNRTTLTSLTIGNSVTSIGDYAFYDCSGLTSVTIPNSVTSIGRSAFRGCSGLTSVTIPNSVTSIGKYAFEGCSGLTSVTIPNSVTSIGDDAFFDCSGLTSLTIGNSVTTIGSSAFWGCSGLTSVIIPNSVTSIGEGAFEDCSGLKELTLEDGEEKLSFGSDVFDETPLESVYLGRSLSDASSASSSLFYSNRTTLTSLTIGNSVTSIGERAFYGCGGLTSVTIPNSVTSIGSGAFWDCSGLTSVTIGDSVTSIGDNAFYNCRGLTSVAIPNSVTSIGGSAFRGCSGLTSVTIPNSVTSIDDYAFLGCRELKQLTIEDGEETLSLGNNGLGTGLFNDCPLESLYLGRNISYDTNSLSLNGDLLTTDLSSTDRTNIEKTDIAEQAYCISTAIQQNSGNGAGHYLRGFTLSDGTSSIEVTDIQPTPLSPIYSDKTSYILTTSPGATLSISAVDMARPEWMHAYVFIDYDNDKEFNQTTNRDGTTGGEVVSFNYYNGSNSKGQTGISENCQVLASNIPSWTLPTDLQLGEYRLRFKIDWNSIDACGAANIVADNGCIVDVTIVVAETGYSPFYNKTTLTSLTIGNSVTSIGENAFSGCSGLTEIYSLNPEPAICNGNSFSQVDKTIPVYIPYGSMSAYKSATEWKDFTNFIEGESNDKEITEDEVLDKDETWGDVNIAPEENKDVILDVNVNIFQAENITINIDKDGKTPQISISVGGEVITKNIKVTRNIKGGIWTMLSLPFDIEISDILVENAQVEIGSNLLVRIYDAAYRAANSVEGKTANGWKEKTSGIIPANQGFAVAINSRYDGDVQEVTFLGRDFAMDGNDKELTLNRHHSTANGGKDADWNFCGNPTLSNQEKESGHSLYIYNSEKNCYDEYSSSQSATYLPFSAWFVQSANDFISMVFSTTSKVIKSENENIEGTITLAINDGDDETSVILNSEASTAYLRNEDALYMESPNTNLSQLYIVEGNTQMAVSEQPTVEGAIKIGYKAAQAGEQTLTLTNLPDNTIAALEDNQTGEQTLMSVGDSYSFTTAAGTNNNRFNLRLTELTGIDQPGTTALKAVVTGDEIKLYGTEAGEEITLYTANGMIITNAVAEESVTTIPTTATGVIIIKVGDEIVKVVK